MKAGLHWETLKERRAKSRVVMLHKIYYSQVAIPISLLPLTPAIMKPRYVLPFYPPVPRTESHGRTFMIAAPTMWNGLPASLTSVSDLEAFRGQLSKVCLSP